MLGMICAAAVAVLTLCTGFPVRAEENVELLGAPIVLDSGFLVMGGHEFALWGIIMPAPDQQCWHDDNPWPCGEQAVMALKHFAEGQYVKCRMKPNGADDRPRAQCFRLRGPNEQDVADYLVRRGWALDNAEESDGLYETEQDRARLKRRGIWASHFQTPQDWRDGILRFYGDDEDRPPSSSPPDDDGE